MGQHDDMGVTMGKQADPAALGRYRAAWRRHEAAAAALPAQDRRPADPDVEPSPEQVELGAAADELLAAAEAIPADVDAVWEANRQAVGDAKAQRRAAVVRLLEVETETGVAARRRNPLDPVRTQDELARCRAAFEAFEAAGVAHDEAIARFKAGVTPEQIEAHL